jgi:multicomponent Na+:H+ antiporter subunit G
VTLEWIRFGISAVLMLTGLLFFVVAVIGAYRFDFVMNRMHTAGIGDSAAIFFVIASCVVAIGFDMSSLKLFLLVFFMWFTSPVATHFLGQVEYYTNPLLSRHIGMIVDIGILTAPPKMKKAPEREEAETDGEEKGGPDAAD